jgi:hypothetical protein
MQYDAEQDKIEYNLLGLFFELSEDLNFVYPTLPWKLGGEIIHEFDHYQFLRENDMVGKGEKQDKFKKTHLVEIEKRAYSKQLDFLKNCLNNVPTSTLMYKLRVEEWAIDGKELKKFEAIALKLPSEVIVESINNAITGYSNVVSKLDEGFDYEDSCDKNNLEINSHIMKALSLSLQIGAANSNYPRVEMKI